ncbi:hypothetical protein HZA87_01510 [Candidatus Uhrbacteria bacterium]|nr:hypothetical protein [Candidatus Uhrbacteria bacterium]
MLDIPGPDERPDILLTIFHLVEDHGHTPMTRKEVESLIRACGPFVSSDFLFRHWLASGYLCERRECFYVPLEHAKRLEQAGLKPALDQQARNGWVYDNTTTGFW